MPVETSRWMRCGTTRYYRVGRKPHVTFANIMDLSTIVSGSGEDGQFDEGSIVVLERRAPFYDWHAVQVGLEKLGPDENEALQIMGIFHGWMRYREKTLKHAREEEVFDIFQEEYGERARNRMLEGVLALIEGLDELYKQDPVVYPRTAQRAVIVAREGSPAERNRGRIQEMMAVPAELLLTRNLSQGLEEAFDRWDLDC